MDLTSASVGVRLSAAADPVVIEERKEVWSVSTDAAAESEYWWVGYGVIVCQQTAGARIKTWRRCGVGALLQKREAEKVIEADADLRHDDPEQRQVADLSLSLSTHAQHLQDTCKTLQG